MSGRASGQASGLRRRRDPVAEALGRERLARLCNHERQLPKRRSVERLLQFGMNIHPAAPCPHLRLRAILRSQARGTSRVM